MVKLSSFGTFPLRNKDEVFDNINIESPLCIGFALFQCWLFLIATETFIPFWFDATPSSFNSVFCITSVVTFLIILFLMGGLRNKITLFVRYKSTHLLAAFIGVLGCMIFAYIVNGGISAIFFISMSAIFQGACFAFQLVLWGEAARRRNLYHLLIFTSTSIIVAYIISYLLINLLPIYIINILVCVIPLFSSVYIYKSQHDNESYFKQQEFITSDDGRRIAKEGARWKESFDALQVSRIGFAFQIGKSTIFFGFVLGFLIVCSTSVFQYAEFDFNSYISLMMSLFSIIVFFVLFSKTLNDTTIVNPIQTLLVFFLTIMLLVSAALDDLSFSSELESISFLILLFTILWVYPAELIQRYRISPLLTYGFFFGLLTIALTPSLYFWQYLRTFIPPSIVLLIAIICLIFGCLFMIDDKQMKGMVKSEYDVNINSNTSSDNNPRPFMMKCQTVADSYLLSKREAEILFLLAKGRNAAYIQHELIISEGTVRTHMRNIYRKLNVHTQQELMNLVENTFVSTGVKND